MRRKESFLRQLVAGCAGYEVGGQVQPLRRNLTATLLFASMWVVLAVMQPTTTYHLAPLIVAASPGLREKDLRTAVSPSLVGFLISVTVTLVLSATGHLNGPSLLPWGGPALESIVAAGVGALLGLAPALLRRRESGEA